MIATGHTYDRVCIERWLRSGHKTCPVTGMRLRHNELTPNFALRNAIQVSLPCVHYVMLKQNVWFMKVLVALFVSASNQGIVRHLHQHMSGVLCIDTNHDSAGQWARKSFPAWQKQAVSPMQSV
jgi:hypothetical protein